MTRAGHLDIGAAQLGFAFGMAAAFVTVYAPTRLGRRIRSGMLPRDQARGLLLLMVPVLAVGIFGPAVASSWLSSTATSVLAGVSACIVTLAGQILSHSAFGKPER